MSERIKIALNESSKDILKCIIVLTSIALIAGVLLGVVNYYTYVDPDKAMTDKISEIYGVNAECIKKDNGRVININGSKSYVDSCFVVYKNLAATTVSNGEEGEKNVPSNEIKAIVYLATGSGAYSGTLQLLIAVENGKIAKIETYAHSETSGIGSKVLEQSNLNKYIGIELSTINDYEPADGKDAKTDRIYISGATRSTRGVLSAIRAVAYSFNTYAEAENE